MTWPDSSTVTSTRTTPSISACRACIVYFGATRHLALRPHDRLTCTPSAACAGASSCCTLCVVASGAGGPRARRGRRARVGHGSGHRQPGTVRVSQRDAEVREPRRCRPAAAAAPRASPPRPWPAAAAAAASDGAWASACPRAWVAAAAERASAASPSSSPATSVIAVACDVLRLRHRDGDERQPGVEHQAPAVDPVGDAIGRPYSLATLMANLVMPCCLARSMTCTTHPWSACVSAVTTRLGSPDRRARLREARRRARRRRR